MDKNKLIKKLYAYRQDPDLYKAPTNEDLADLVILVLNVVKNIEESMEKKKVDVEAKYDTQAKNVLQKAQTDSVELLKQVRKEVNQLLSQGDTVLSSTATALEQRVQEALANIRNGNDGIVTEAEIERAAELALGMLELPDFDALVTEAITSNSEAIRNSLELLVGENRYKVEIADVDGLRQALDDLAVIRSTSGAGGLGKRQVFDFIREAIANGIIVSSGVSDGDKGDITVSGAGTVWTIDDDTVGLDELSATGTADNTKFLRGDNTWAVPPGSSGGITRSVSSISTPTTAGATTVTDYVYNVTNTTLTLPTVVGNTNQYTVKCISGTCVVEGDGAETIEGSANITIQVEDSVDLVSNNTEWKVV